MYKNWKLQTDTSMPWAKYIVNRGIYDDDGEVKNWCAKHLHEKYYVGYFVWFESLEDKVKYVLKWL